MSLDSAVPPPWLLHGEAVAFLAPGFRLRLLVNYHDSPVGPYLEHALLRLTAHGPSVVQMSVNLEASRRCGRENWGFPKVLEHLSWKATRKNITFSRHNQQFRIRKTGLRFPIAMPFWTVQEKDGALVRVPASLKGRVGVGFRGRQVAFILEEFEMTFEGPQPLN